VQQEGVTVIRASLTLRLRRWKRLGVQRPRGDESVRIHRLIWDPLVAELEEAAATTEQLQVELEEHT
jgi:hypothetical protein